MDFESGVKCVRVLLRALAAVRAGASDIWSASACFKWDYLFSAQVPLHAAQHLQSAPKTPQQPRD